MKQDINNKANLFDGAPVGSKDGIEIEKGVTLNEEYLLKNINKIQNACQFFTAYPDLLK